MRRGRAPRSGQRRRHLRDSPGVGPPAPASEERAVQHTGCRRSERSLPPGRGVRAAHRDHAMVCGAHEKIICNYHLFALEISAFRSPSPGAWCPCRTSHRAAFPSRSGGRVRVAGWSNLSESAERPAGVGRGHPALPVLEPLAVQSRRARTD
jgi:hypothetical protein